MPFAEFQSGPHDRFATSFFGRGAWRLFAGWLGERSADIN
jgi:hypothetical protein